jgi:pimeloyl-ACP methyl ester carboxylesterase
MLDIMHTAMHTAKLTAKLTTLDGHPAADAATPPPSPAWTKVYDTLTRPRHRSLSDQETLLLYSARRRNLPFEGGHITAWHWGDSGPHVLLVHGWESRASHWQAWLEPLLQGGFQISALDNPAHGHASGDTTDVLQCGRAVRIAGTQLGALWGELHAVIGHSMGSAACLHAFAHGLHVKISVHLAGPLSLTRVLRYAGDANGLDAIELDALLAAFTRRIRQPLTAMDLPALAPGLRHPALIFHDPEDAEIPLVESSQLAAAWPLARLIKPVGLGHRRILRDPQVIRQSVAALLEAGTALR